MGEGSSVTENEGSTELENRTVIRNNRERYCLLLGRNGKELPKSPEDLPNSIFLPVDLLGDMEQALSGTEEDEAERNQAINWDFATQSFAKDNIKVGLQYGLKYREMFRRVFKSYFGRKDLLEYHTHPYGYWFASFGDAAFFQVYPRDAYIHAVVSNEGISFFFQTAKSAKVPFSNTWRMIFGSELPKYLDQQLIANYWEREGYGYYFWSPPKENIQKGDLSQDILIKKVMQSAE